MINKTSGDTLDTTIVVCQKALDFTVKANIIVGAISGELMPEHDH